LSPILVRPVREQLEHDRVIRLLQAKYKRKFDVAINPGNEQAAGVGNGPSPWYPDLVLHSTERTRKLLGVVEVETVESINHLEAMSQWAAFSRLKTPFHLYVPAAMVEVARRFCVDLQIAVTEIWAYHAIGDQIRFNLVQRAPGADDISSSVIREPRRPKVPAAAVVAARTPPSRASKPAQVKPVPKAAPKVASKPALKPAPKPTRRDVPPARKVVPPARTKVARTTKSVKAARPAAKKSVGSAAKRK
jgi:hypothetical protein